MIRLALKRLGEVNTVVFQPGKREAYDAEWNSENIKRITYTTIGPSITGLFQRNRIRNWFKAQFAIENYDLIVVCFVSTAALLPRDVLRKVIIDADDLGKTFLTRQKLSSRLKTLALDGLAQIYGRQVGHVWYVNPADEPKILTNNKSYLPNTIRFPDLKRQRKSPIPGRILMVGLMEHEPNFFGATWFALNVLPRLSNVMPVELHIVGRISGERKAALEKNNIVVRGFVENITSEYDSAALVIAPIFSGGGTQIKVIDALAHERPLVCTPFAHSGFADDLQNERDLLLAARDVEDWVKACAGVLLRPDDYLRMARHGRDSIARYSTENFEKTVTATVEMLVKHGEA
ncbi:MAG: glycosyltransferase family 4 protein [Hyphomicrobiales bacterium]